jgi:hypothetical protein
MANNIVVYTAISDSKDTLKWGQNTEGNVDFIAYLDGPVESDVWDTRTIDKVDRDPNRNAKQYKILPHKFFPDYEYSLWIDGSIELVVPVQTLIDKYLKDANWAQFKHPGRDCAYEEAVTCINLKKDDELIISEQMARYHEEGLPDHAGLNECTILLRRHNEADVIAFDEMWWEEIDKGSKRDQLSYSYCLWKTKLQMNLMPGTVEVLYTDPACIGNDYFVHTKHLK